MADADKKRLLGVVLIVGAVVVGFLICRSQWNNQIVRPIPNGPPAPVVPQLPDIAADLRQAKAICEDRARAVKELAAKRRLGAAELDQVRQLYAETKATHDACIDFLTVGLTRRFREDDPAKLRQRLTTARDRMATFVAWVNRVLRPGVGEADPLADLLNLIPALWDGTDKANEEAIEALKADLDKCRLLDWSDL